ncbi:MAG: hypothetical protein ABSF96_07240 [Steroidobacteraceae bacterium]
MISPWRPLAACAALGAAPLVAADGRACHAQIIVLPAPGTESLSDQRALQALAHQAHVELRLIRAIGPKLYLLVLSDGDNDPDCTAAIARLQADPRLLSVERDARRQSQDH